MSIPPHCAWGRAIKHGEDMLTNKGLVLSSLKTRAKVLNLSRLSDCLNKHASCTARPFALTSSWVNVLALPVALLLLPLK